MLTRIIKSIAMAAIAVSMILCSATCIPSNGIIIETEPLNEIAASQTEVNNSEGVRTEKIIYPIGETASTYEVKPHVSNAAAVQEMLKDLGPGQTVGYEDGELVVYNYGNDEIVMSQEAAMPTVTAPVFPRSIVGTDDRVAVINPNIAPFAM